VHRHFIQLLQLLQLLPARTAVHVATTASTRPRATIRELFCARYMIPPSHQDYTKPQSMHHHSGVMRTVSVPVHAFCWCWRWCWRWQNLVRRWNIASRIQDLPTQHFPYPSICHGELQPRHVLYSSMLEISMTTLHGHYHGRDVVWEEQAGRVGDAKCESIVASTSTPGISTTKT